MRIAILGAGNMGGAVARGLVRSGVGSTADKAVKAGDITVTAGHDSTLEAFRKEGFETDTDNAKAVKGADIVMIAVKPAIVPKVLEEIKDELNFSSQTLVCIAAGIKLETFDSILGEKDGKKAEVVFLIPDTAIEICRGINFLSPARASQKTMTALLELMEGTGTNHVVDMQKLKAGMVLASCGTAYAMKYIQAIAEIGESMGFDSRTALDTAIKTVGGAAALLKFRNSLPFEEIRRVATPGGFTERGMKKMDEAGFIDALKAAHEI